MKTAVFSGTSDGKELCAFLEKMNIKADVFVATDYGREVMPAFKGIAVFSGRLCEKEMEERLCLYRLVIDATHPYAVEVSENLKKACNTVNVPYIRLLRKIECYGEFNSFSSVDEAVLYLAKKSGNIFVSTGSKEIEKYTAVDNFKNRVYGRCLDSGEVIEKCRNSGFDLNKFIFKKGPFSYEENYKAFKENNIKYLVTKQTGKNGGFDEKFNAAKALGCQVVLIKPPAEEKGYNIEEVKEIIKEKYNIGLKFPLFVNLKGKKAVVIGAGNIGKRRIKTLMEFNADIYVVDDKTDIETESFKNITIIKRKFEENDLNNAFLAVAATDSRIVNHEIYELCGKKNILVSVADSREESSFFFPAVCIGEKLVAGLSSDGSDHCLVRKKAEEIRRLIGADE